MPTLVLLRHAEAIPSKGDDHARPLTEQGRSDATAVGRLLESALRGAARVLASDARRTLETAELAFPAATRGGGIRGVPSLYDATPATILDVIRTASPSDETIVIVGHNPGLSELARQLAVAGSQADRDRVAAGLPTAGAALYRFDGPWSAVDPEGGRLTATLVPDGRAWPA